MGKSLNDIKRDIALLTLNIECLDPGSKHSAIGHLEETIGLLKIGAEHDLATFANQDDAWMFIDDIFVDDIDYESNIGTVPVQDKEHHEKESFTDHRNNEDQIPNNEIKQEPVQQEPVVISLNPDTYQGQIASENDMIKCDPCNVYLPRSYTMKRHEEDPKHLANVTTDTTVPVKQIAKMSEPEESLKHIEKRSFSGSKSVEKDTERTPKLNENYSQAEVGMNLYQCPECPTQYNKKNSLVKHRFMHTGKFKCQKCKEPFTSKRGLIDHNRNPNNCLSLQKKRASRNNIAEPHRLKDGMNLYQCPECPKQYNKKNSLMKHRFMHTGKVKSQKCRAPFTSRKANPSNCLTLKKRRASRNSIAANKPTKKDTNTKKENKDISTQKSGLAKKDSSERSESTFPKQIIEMTVDKSPESEVSLNHMPSSKEGNTTATTHACKICLKQFNRKVQGVPKKTLDSV